MLTSHGYTNQSDLRASAAHGSSLTGSLRLGALLHPISMQSTDLEMGTRSYSIAEFGSCSGRSNVFWACNSALQTVAHRLHLGTRGMGLAQNPTVFFVVSAVHSDISVFYSNLWSLFTLYVR